MKQTTWSPRRRIEEAYRRQLTSLLERYLKLPDDATLAELMTRLTDFRRLSTVLQSYANSAAAQMVTAVKVDSAKTWREAARQGTAGRRIFEALHQEMRGLVGYQARMTVQTNAELISSLPLELAQQANHYILKAHQQGLRAEAIEFHLKRRFPRLVRSRVALIARTETSKASTALTRARSEELGLSWYVWRTSKDVRVRPSHRLMNGVLVPFNNDPAPEQLAGEQSSLGHYAAGEAPNCRCYPEPFLRWSQLQWPHKVYYAERIQYMTLAAFRKISTTYQLEAIA